MKAQRGQIAVLETLSTYTGVGFKATSKIRFHLIHVLGASRDGCIIQYRRLGDSHSRKSTPAKSLLIAKGSIDEEALLADMDAKVKLQWDANDFASLDAVKDYVTRFKERS